MIMIRMAMSMVMATCTRESWRPRVHKYCGPGLPSATQWKVTLSFLLAIWDLEDYLHRVSKKTDFLNWGTLHFHCQLTSVYRGDSSSSGSAQTSNSESYFLGHPVPWVKQNSRRIVDVKIGGCHILSFLVVNKTTDVCLVVHPGQIIQILFYMRTMLMVMMLLIHTIHTIMLPIYLEISSMSKLLLTIPSNSAPLKNQR